MKLFVLLLCSICTAFCQEANFQPQYWLGAGSSYNYYAAPPAGAGWISFAAKVTDRTYSFSTIDMTQTQAAIRTGVARILSQTGNISLLALGDAGLTTLNGVALGSFSGGGILLYDLGALTPRLQHVYLTGALRVIGTGSTSVQPVFELGLSFSLGK